jgi:hypothetical protein
MPHQVRHDRELEIVENGIVFVTTAFDARLIQIPPQLVTPHLMRGPFFLLK